MTTLVLLPGLDGTGLLFQPLLAELPSSWRVQVVAYPADPGADHDALARIAAAALPAEGPLVLLGESFSGPIAIRLAATLAPRVTALVLCCSFVRNPRPALAGLAPLVGMLPAPARLPSAWAARPLLGSRPAAAVRRLLASALEDLPAAVLHARLRMVTRVDATHELAALRVPVCYLQGADDLIVPDSAGRLVQRLQPTTALRRLAGPHGLLQAAPQACTAALTAFLGDRL